MDRKIGHLESTVLANTTIVWGRATHLREIGDEKRAHIIPDRESRLNDAKYLETGSILPGHRYGSGDR